MKASSESGECASLISTASFSVFEAVCWPGMGVSVSFSSATPASRVVSYTTGSGCLALALVLPRDFPAKERSIGEEREKTRASQGACWALGRAISCKEKPSILAPHEQLRGPHAPGARALKRRDHAGDGVVEGGVAVQIRLPEFLQQLEIVIPASLVEAFAQGVGSVAAARGGAILVAGSRTGGAEHG